MMHSQNIVFTRNDTDFIQVWHASTGQIKKLTMFDGYVWHQCKNDVWTSLSASTIPKKHFKRLFGFTMRKYSKLEGSIKTMVKYDKKK